jgi:hypothetical protein
MHYVEIHRHRRRKPAAVVLTFGLLFGAGIAPMVGGWVGQLREW